MTRIADQAPLGGSAPTGRPITSHSARAPQAFASGTDGKGEFGLVGDHGATGQTGYKHQDGHPTHRAAFADMTATLTAIRSRHWPDMNNQHQPYPGMLSAFPHPNVCLCARSPYL